MSTAFGDKDALVSVLLAEFGGADNVSVSEANGLGVLHGPLAPRRRVVQERVLFAKQVLARVVGERLIAERAQRIGVDRRLCTAGARIQSVRSALWDESVMRNSTLHVRVGSKSG